MKLFSIVFLMFTCLCATCCATTPHGKPTPKMKVIQCEDSVMTILGDSVCTVLFSSNKAVLYKMSSSVKAGDKDETIGGYKVEHKVGNLDKTTLSILQFMFSDRSEYFMGDVYPSAPFMPEVAVKFTNKKNVVDLVFSFSGRQVEIVYNGHSVKTLKYYHERLVLLYFSNLLQDSELKEQLNLIKY